MRKFSFLLVILAVAAIIGVQVSRTHAANDSTSMAKFNSDGTLVRPEGYRRWIYLSSGFGMSYQPDPSGSGAPMFTNVFVNPTSYDYYLANGKWPDKTVFVLEMYGSSSHGSINKSGSFQEAFHGLDVEVKDEARFADKWAYFGFDGDEKSSRAMAPSKNECWKCHDQNAAVEHSFVQFYPELLKIAKSKGTIKPGVLK